MSGWLALAPSCVAKVKDIAGEQSTEYIRVYRLFPPSLSLIIAVSLKDTRGSSVFVQPTRLSLALTLIMSSDIFLKVQCLLRTTVSVQHTRSSEDSSVRDRY
jgi:hypothetical protein